jgi:trehalose synthase
MDLAVILLSRSRNVPSGRFHCCATARARMLSRQPGARRSRKRFLLTRLIADELRLLGSLLGVGRQASTAVAQIALAGENRCPVCGMRVDTSIAVALQVQGRTHYFCAAGCKEIFEQNPGRFERLESRGGFSGKLT